MFFIEEGYIEDDFHAAVLTWEMIKSKTFNEGLNVRLFPLQHLLLRLSEMFRITMFPYDDNRFFSLAMAKDQISRDRHQYADIGCPWHVANYVSNHCCLAKVQRWGFILVDHCLNKDVDILIPGRHYPMGLHLIEDEVMSSVENESYWASNKTDSLRRLTSLGSVATGAAISLLGSVPKGSSSSYGETKSHGLECSIDNLRKKYPTGSALKLIPSMTSEGEKQDLMIELGGTHNTLSQLRSSVVQTMLPSSRIAASLTKEDGSDMTSAGQNSLSLGRSREKSGAVCPESSSTAQPPSLIAGRGRGNVATMNQRTGPNLLFLARGRGTSFATKPQYLG